MWFTITSEADWHFLVGAVDVQLDTGAFQARTFYQRADH